MYSDNWRTGYLSKQPVPYAYTNEDFICYDDMDSINFKAKYAKSNQLAGISLFSLDLDDFNGLFCMNGNFPLVRTIKNNLKESESDFDDEDIIVKIHDEAMKEIEKEI